MCSIGDRSRSLDNDRVLAAPDGFVSRSKNAEQDAWSWLRYCRRSKTAEAVLVDHENETNQRGVSLSRVSLGLGRTTVGAIF
jgi:hypothetical protein